MSEYKIMQASPLSPASSFSLSHVPSLSIQLRFFSLPIFSPTFLWVKSRGWRMVLCVPEIRHSVRCHKWLMQVPVCARILKYVTLFIVTMINAGSRVCPYSEIRHPFRCHKWLMQVPVCACILKYVSLFVVTLINAAFRVPVYWDTSRCWLLLVINAGFRAYRQPSECM